MRSCSSSELYVIFLLLAFALALALAGRLTPWVARWGRSVGALDPVTSRSVHSEPIPRVGGLGVAAAVFAAVGVGLAATGAPLQPGPTVAFFVGGAAILTLGLIDDFRPLRPEVKLVGQCLVAFAVAALGVRIEKLGLPGVGVLSTGDWATPLTVLWLVAVMNAINLLDGLDGLASGVALVIVAPLLLVSALNDQGVGVLIGLSLAGALLGFLRHNSHPASVFLGDSGALFVGFVLGIWSVLAWQKSATGLAVLVVLLAFALPLADTGFAVVRRIAAGRSPLEADAHHIHHRLLRRGVSHPKSVVLLCSIASVGALGAVAAFLLA